MMNDMMPTIEETLTPDVDAQLEHERGEHEAEARERAEAWECIEAAHGPLHRHDYSVYTSMGWKD